MSTRILPVGFYREQDQPSTTTSTSSSSSSSNSDEKNSSASLTKRFNTYRPYENESVQFSTSCSTTSSSSTKKQELLINRTQSSNANLASSTNSNSAVAMPMKTSTYSDTLTIEQNLFNMVRFDVIKSNFCDYYQVGDFVRSGGFSDIHQGIRLSDNKQVVVKFIPKEKTKNWLMVSQKNIQQKFYYIKLYMKFKVLFICMIILRMLIIGY